MIIVIDNIKIFIENVKDSKAVCAEPAIRMKHKNFDIHTSLNKCILLEIINSND
jgi:hypothetical protein